MAAPDVRYRMVLNKATGKDELVDKILSDLSWAPYRQCLDVFVSKTKRSYMEACLLTGASLEEICKILDLPLDVVDLYGKVFYDVQGLDKLSRLDLLENDNNGDRVLKLWAVSEGLSFIAWRLGKSANMSPTDGLQSLFSMCMYKAKEGLFNPNSAKSSIEATKWTKLAMELAKLIKSWVHDGKEAKRDLELAIREVVPEFPGLDSLD